MTDKLKRRFLEVKLLTDRLADIIESNFIEMYDFSVGILVY